EALRFLQVGRHVCLRARGRFTQGRENLRGKIFVRFEHKNAPALVSRISGLSCFVHVQTRARLTTVRAAGHALIRHACFPENGKYFSYWRDGLFPVRDGRKRKLSETRQ